MANTSYAADETEHTEIDVFVKLIHDFADFYQILHHPIILLAAVFGIVTNMFNVLLLRKCAMTGAINTLLLSLSFSQMAMLLSTLLVNVLGLLQPNLWDASLIEIDCSVTYRSHNWMHFILLNFNLSLLFHVLTTAHVIILSVVRYLLVCCTKQFSQQFLAMMFSKIVIPLLYILVPVVCIPFYLNSSVEKLTLPEDIWENCQHLMDQRNDVFTIRFSRLAKQASLLEFNYWFFSIVCKLVPCIVTAGLNLLIVVKLRRHMRYSTKLAWRSESHATTARKRRVAKFRSHRRIQRYDNTSRLLCVVVTLFVAVEFPQGLLNMLTGILGSNFHRAIHKPLANFFDMLTVLYTSVSFILYCLMCAKYRTRVREVCCCWLPASKISDDQPILEEEPLQSISLKRNRTVSGRLRAHTTAMNHRSALPSPKTTITNTVHPSLISEDFIQHNSAV